LEEIARTREGKWVRYRLGYLSEIFEKRGDESSSSPSSATMISLTEG